MLAQDEARRLQHGFIGTEHLLPGLLRESGSIAARALADLGVSLDKARSKVEATVGPGREGSAPTSPPFTPRTKKVLELDHWRIPFCQGGPTSLDNLCRVCRAHHRMKTHRGFVLDGGPGGWRWRPPRVLPPLEHVPASPAHALALARC